MSFNLEQMEPSSKGEISMPIHMGSQQFPSANKQSAQVDLLPRFHTATPVNFASQQLHSSVGDCSENRIQGSVPVNHGSYSLGFTNNQLVQWGRPLKVQTPIPVYMGFQQLSSTNRLPLGKESLRIQNPMPISVASQFSASHKRPAQKEALPKIQNSISSNMGLQQLPLTNKRAAQAEPPPKAQTESFESVRVKLRESLAASLATDSQQKEKPKAVEKSDKDAPSMPCLAEVDMQATESCSTPSNPSLHGNSLEILTSDEHTLKCDEGQEPSDTGSNENTSDHTKALKSSFQENQQTVITLDDESPLGDNPIINDELLQGHGLCWESDLNPENSEIIAEADHGVKKPKLVHEEISVNTEGTSLQTPENLAVKIEAELFKLFGGVNKKYKEKARSLLFNLKDRSNPELRERVLSGEIAPERLCSMTAEELASKELSEWRLAKAEELAQMVVLPDSDVDIRRLVKKTHKGEFQVEVERDDSISVEVAVGTSSLYRPPTTKANKDVQTRLKSSDKGQTLPKSGEDLQLTEKADSGDQNAAGNLDILLNEKADFMQDFMVDELKDTELLPPVVSLDEFMEALDSEPPFENLSVDTAQEKTPSPTEKATDCLEPERNASSDSLGPKEDLASDDVESKLDSQDNLGSKLSPADKGLGNNEEIVEGNTDKDDTEYAKGNGNLKSGSLHNEPDTCLPDSKSHSEKIWEGLIQLNISSLVTAVGFFRSGEKPNTQEWPTFLEIKGRVRLEGFEKFLQELPLSRSRAIMVAQFCWKDGTPESGRLNLCETVDSYIADGRVGFAEPAPGVELYFCPPHPKMTEMLSKNLPKEHTNTLHSTINGLIGVVVWRRAHVTTISPRLPSHKHGNSSTKRHLGSRKQQTINSNSTCRSSNPLDEPIDDVPPGFGPGNSREEDDLPEFDFARSRLSTPTPSRPSGMNLTHPHVPQPSRPVDQMRELIHRYGQTEAPKKPGYGTDAQPWKSDDDDIPEWQPHQENQPQPPQQQFLPPPPPQPQPLYGYQQQNSQPLNQQFVPMAQPNLPPQQFMQVAAPVPVPLQLLLQPQMGLVPGAQTVQPGWQQAQAQAQWWLQPRGPADVGVGMGLPVNGLMQPCNSGGQPSEGQFYGMQMPGFGAVQSGGMGWRPDAPRRQ